MRGYQSLTSCSHYGLKDFQYYTVVFGTSRAMGVAAQLVWDRGAFARQVRMRTLKTLTVYGLPIERSVPLS